MTVRINETGVDVFVGKIMVLCLWVKGIGRFDIPRVNDNAIFNHHSRGRCEGGICQIDFFGGVDVRSTLALGI